jgi:acyl-CoA hydrolase
MVKMEDLNHHHNLYAGRAIEWMIEASFIAVSLEYGDGDGLLYKNTHQFSFEKSVAPGEIISFRSTVVRAGKKSLTIRVGLISEKTGELKAEGYTTFVSVNPHTKDSVEHGILLDEIKEPNELSWRAKANTFFE